MIRVCATCPWLKENHGKPHPHGWYLRGNLRRLWNGLRTGKAPGMVCHSSDPASSEYGSTKIVHPDTERRDCAGALILIIRHINECEASSDLREYRAKHGKNAVTLAGLRYWVYRHLFRRMPPVEDFRTKEVGLPWE